MAEGFRKISLTIWEKMNIKGEGENGTRRNGRKGRKEGVMVKEPHMEHAT